MKIIALTFVSLIAFAANSVLCRLALKSNEIDPISFTTIRLISGAVILFLILISKGRQKLSLNPRSLVSSGSLLIYALGFSLAYLKVETGIGALILFGAVQLTIILNRLYVGIRLTSMEWVGAILAFLGLVYLISPGNSGVNLSGFILMTAAGVAWGIYTLKGKEVSSSLKNNANNFILACIPMLFIQILFQSSPKFSNLGIQLALTSGALTSGLGYTIWYLALKGLTPITAAVVQLSVPIIAAFGGVLFVSELISSKLMISSVLTLFGILIVSLAPKFSKR